VIGIIRRIDLLRALLSAAVESSPSTQVPSPGTRTDEALRLAVARAVRRLGIHLGVGFDVVDHDGKVHLWGEVVSDADWQACIAAASAVPGVSTVTSHIQVMSRHRRTAHIRET
jgi:osmotically-inducible protein OsmY